MNTTRYEEHPATAELAKTELMGSPTGQPVTEAGHPLFPEDAANDMRSKWNEIQTEFVDEPRKAVQQADELVAEAIKRLSDRFADERSRLEQQGVRGDAEQLRIALQTYRSFFHRLLAI